MHSSNFAGFSGLVEIIVLGAGFATTQFRFIDVCRARLKNRVRSGESETGEVEDMEIGDDVRQCVDW